MTPELEHEENDDDDTKDEEDKSLFMKMRLKLNKPARHPLALGRRWCMERGKSLLSTRLLFFALCLIWIPLISYKAWKRTLPTEDPCVVLERSTPVLGASRLPKIIHQVWPKQRNMPSHVKRWFSKWDELFPGFEHKLWSDEDIRELIAKDFPWFLPVFDKYPLSIMRADAARPFILFKYGGLYADMDYQPLVNFWDRLPDDTPSVIQSFWAHEAFQNSFMSTPPRHELWNRTWEIMVSRAKERLDGEVFWWDTLYLTGPQVLEKAIIEYHQAHQGDDRKVVHVLPCENWHRVSTGYQFKLLQNLQRFHAYYFKDSFRKCGSVYDMRCQMGIHHSTTMWEH